MKLFRRSQVVAVLVLLASPPAAQEVHYRVPLDELDVVDGTVATGVPAYDAMRWRGDVRALWPRIVVPGGEGYFDPPPGATGWGATWDGASLVVRMPELAPGEVRGRLLFPDSSWTRLEAATFVLPADAASGGDEAEKAFRRAKHLHYLRLANEDLPGAAWFRHRERETRGDGFGDDPRWLRGTSVEDETSATYALFTGGRALAENLQLDRALPETDAAAEATVALDSVRGVTVREWEPELAGEDPPLDPLAAIVPADQHAVFFGSFGELVRLNDETERFGAPVLGAMETRSQSARTIARYERQLGLSLDAAARALGPLVVASVALTGSDPYLRTGSDVAVLFESEEPATLQRFVAMRQAAALATEPGAEAVSGDAGGVPYEGVVSPSRRVSSYSATVGGHVVVTNSLRQLERIARAASSGETLQASPDYRFFRRRYPLAADGETAFVVVPDAAIRRWCGPRWRIATARRTLAMAALAELQAEHLGRLAAGPESPLPLEAPESLAPYGPFALTAGGVVSGRYGSLDFLTPVSELDFEKVTEEEARLYGLWRDGYERNWSNFFDPIAIRFAVADERLEVDVSVIPLIGASEYRDFRDFVGETVLEPGEADPHAEVLAQFAMSVDTESEAMRELNQGVGAFLQNVGAAPFSWFRGDLALYVDESPFLAELAELGDLEEVQEALEVDLNELPIVLHLGATGPLKLAAFLTSLRALADNTVPGLLAWTTLETEEGHGYVRIGGERFFGEDYFLYYSATPRSLLLALNEEALQAAIARAYARVDALQAADGKASGPASGDDAFPTGAGVALEVRRGALAFLEAFGDDSYHDWIRAQAWANLPILNEWKRLFAERDPVAVHRALWGEELVCPGGGDYVWNAEAHTVESTVYGHPADPREGPGLPRALRSAERLRAELNFRDEGLRARVELRRE